MAWAGVWHPKHPEHALSLVLVRGDAEPWYLLSSEPISSSEEDGWLIALAYLHGFQIEQVFRLDKSEFGLESVRIWARA